MAKTEDDHKMSLAEKADLLQAQYQMAKQKAASLDLKAQQSQEVDYQEQHLQPQVPEYKTKEKDMTKSKKHSPSQSETEKSIIEQVPSHLMKEFIEMLAKVGTKGEEYSPPLGQSGDVRYPPVEPVLMDPKYLPDSNDE